MGPVWPWPWVREGEKERAGGERKVCSYYFKIPARIFAYISIV